MIATWRRGALWATLFFTLCFAVTFALDHPLDERKIALGAWDMGVLGDALAHIRTKGITPELNDLLTSARSVPNWVATLVSQGRLIDGTASPVVAADPPELAGMQDGEAAGALPRKWNQVLGGGSTHVTAPDGTEYSITIWVYDWHTWPIIMRKTLFISLFAAWLSLAAWIFLDARERLGTGPASGWSLLSLLTGPLALAVWLTYRHGRAGTLAACPNCGADAVRGAAFCVRCGGALRPTCEQCQRPVEFDWAHCAGCGARQE